MRLLQPSPPPYDPIECEALPLAERGRLLCEAWALQGYGAPVAIYVVYALKVALYVGGWLLCCRATAGLGELATIDQWWLEPIAFQKAILWSMVFEGLGLGCGSGPLTGRYAPPIGGFLYFLRPGTTKLPLFPGLPLLGGIRRTWLDVALYVGLMAVLVRALAAPAIGAEHLWPIVALVPLIALADRTIFLALRSEHYWTTALCFLFAGQWIAGAKAVQLALWFWAGVSKLNRHFATVVCVMVSNSPWMRIPWVKKRMYRRFPDDLRPSRLAAILGHFGTLLEFAVPLVLLFAPAGAPLLVGMILMLMLHAYITSNVPMGVPIEWNVMVVYGAFALFWAHPEVHVWDLGSPPLAVALAVLLIGVPVLGNLYPRAISFLMAMRYYAGNWAYGVWLFRGEGSKKLERLTKSSPWVDDQLARFYDHRTARGLITKVMAFRLMHLHGRALPVLLPKAVPRLEDYEYTDGEIVAGIVLGWNFGDGHLHREPLLAAVQAQCAFEPGELRCVFVESQPLGGDSLTYRIHDAATGLVEEGSLAIRELCERQPWSAT
ncbi:MAG: DUF3556 domain-containing protein [Nannocystaceae bacterium]